MRNFLRCIPLLGAALLVGMVHTHLVKSSPTANEVLGSAPKELKLWFNARPEIAFTSVTLLRADSTRVATIKAVATTDSLAAAIPLATPLPAGGYIVNWRTASADGHAIRGSFGFSISP